MPTKTAPRLLVTNESPQQIIFPIGARDAFVVPRGDSEHATIPDGARKLLDAHPKVRIRELAG
jgi:hypothetical protein